MAQKLYADINTYLLRNGNPIRDSPLAYDLRGAKVTLNYLVASNDPTAALNIAINANQPTLEKVTNELTREVRRIKSGLQKV